MFLFSIYLHYMFCVFSRDFLGPGVRMPYFNLFVQDLFIDSVGPGTSPGLGAGARIMKNK